MALAKKAVDVNIAVDIVAGALRDQYDILILISNDGDYSGAIAAAREVGKKVYFAWFKDGPSYHLRMSTDGYFEIETREMKTLLFYPPRNRRR